MEVPGRRRVGAFGRGLSDEPDTIIPDCKTVEKITKKSAAGVKNHPHGNPAALNRPLYVMRSKSPSRTRSSRPVRQPRAESRTSGEGSSR